MIFYEKSFKIAQFVEFYFFESFGNGPGTILGYSLIVFGYIRTIPSPFLGFFLIFIFPIYFPIYPYIYIWINGWMDGFIFPPPFFKHLATF